MLFAQNKALNRAQELYARRFLDMTDLTPLDAMDACPDGVHARAPERVEGYTLQPGDHIVGRDRYVWIRKTVEVPETREGCRVTAMFDLGGGHCAACWLNLPKIPDELKPDLIGSQHVSEEDYD